jgi:hypothetical protein
MKKIVVKTKDKEIDLTTKFTEEDMNERVDSYSALSGIMDEDVITILFSMISDNIIGLSIKLDDIESISFKEAENNSISDICNIKEIDPKEDVENLKESYKDVKKAPIIDTEKEIKRIREKNFLERQLEKEKREKEYMFGISKNSILYQEYYSKLSFWNKIIFNIMKKIYQIKK